MLAHALPHQPRPADLGERGRDEQDDAAQRVHGRDPTGPDGHGGPARSGPLHRLARWIQANPAAFATDRLGDPHHLYVDSLYPVLGDGVERFGPRVHRG
ncbi:hypothetical protein GCM10023340_14120 [Nocardioides marinquilinus]|uniref:Uncharacterized protein n=1 Tax=Nocardioides marinquilinus TaxID=1210400 RepID=A0ABP9PEA2_9ACTN